MNVEIIYIWKFSLVGMGCRRSKGWRKFLNLIFSNELICPMYAFVSRTIYTELCVMQELCLHTKLLAPANTPIADFLARAIDPPSSLVTRNAVQLLKVSQILQKFIRNLISISGFIVYSWLNESAKLGYPPYLFVYLFIHVVMCWELSRKSHHLLHKHSQYLLTSPSPIFISSPTCRRTICWSWCLMPSTMKNPNNDW